MYFFVSLETLSSEYGFPGWEEQELWVSTKEDPVKQEDPVC